MDIKSQIRILINSDDRKTIAFLKKLAERLDLPEPTRSIGDADFFFLMNGERLELHPRIQGTTKQSALFVDFLSGAPFYRFVNNRTIRQPLAKAVGIKQGYRPTVLDATAGFGEDSFVLAALGCDVTMLERSPLIWALLDNAISRCRLHPEIDRIFAQHVDHHLTDTLQFISTCQRNYDTVFLDPMYPHSSKSSLNKQKMRMLRILVGSDTDSDLLLKTALTHAEKRVVVKRPVRAESLAGLDPSYAIATKSSRYDIYLCPWAGYL